MEGVSNLAKFSENALNLALKASDMKLFLISLAFASAVSAAGGPCSYWDDGTVRLCTLCSS